MLKDRTNTEIDYAAIHRALLAGLLGNIGQKTDFRDRFSSSAGRSG